MRSYSAHARTHSSRVHSTRAGGSTSVSVSARSNSIARTRRGVDLLKLARGPGAGFGIGKPIGMMFLDLQAIRGDDGRPCHRRTDAKRPECIEKMRAIEVPGKAHDHP